MYWLEPHNDNVPFPDVEHALREPDGLLAAGGDLSPRRLLSAYRHGIFPWYSAGQPILWWSPDPRTVLYPDELHVSRSLRKTLRKGEYEVRYDTAFNEVIRSCAAPRGDGQGTWLTEEMVEAYCLLHRLGHAHSAEAWCKGELVGGLYGVAIGGVFFGESMFAHRPDASKVAFVHLVMRLKEAGYGLIDCQVASAHLARFGAVSIPRQRFIQELHAAWASPVQAAPWQVIVYERRHA